MASLLASDLHLDADEPWAIDAFVKFLEGRARGSDSLYLLGDLFEVWVGDDDRNESIERVCVALSNLTGSGVTTFVVHGNRDFLMGPDFAARTGVTLLPDPVLVELHGVATLLSHGDVFCTEDPSYQHLRSIVRRPSWQRRFLSLPLEARRDLADAARAGSKAHTQRVIPQIMDVNPQAVADALRVTGASRLIHGHTHRPAIHKFTVDGRAAERVVLAPWYEAASCVSIDSSGATEIPLPR